MSKIDSGAELISFMLQRDQVKGVRNLIGSLRLDFGCLYFSEIWNWSTRQWEAIEEGSHLMKEVFGEGESGNAAQKHGRRRWMKARVTGMEAAVVVQA